MRTLRQGAIVLGQRLPELLACIRWTRTSWLFLAVMIDLFSRRIVAWATSATNDRFLALDALHDAIMKRRPGAGLVQHSDRGSPCASDDYRAELARFCIIASMSRKGDCWDCCPFPGIAKNDPTG